MRTVTLYTREIDHDRTTSGPDMKSFKVIWLGLKGMFLIDKRIEEKEAEVNAITAANIETNQHARASLERSLSEVHALANRLQDLTPNDARDQRPIH